jgi:poly(3-hydroxybutyrate) depolymerase
MRALTTALAAAAAVLLLSACGGSSYLKHPVETGPYTGGANGVWVFRPAGKPKAVVIFFHGQGGPTEAEPANHIAWINDLLNHGAIVVYPRWELSFVRAAMPHVLAGVKKAVSKVDMKGLPVLSLGYSRGGGLAVEYAAEAARHHLPVPKAVLSVFPAQAGDWSRLINLKPIPHSTPIVLMVGQQDTEVGSSGARFLMLRLAKAKFPPGRVQVRGVSSHGTFIADHAAPMGISPEARQAFWVPAERLLERIEGK